MSDGGNGARRDQDEDDREQGDRPEIAAELAVGAGQRRPIEKRGNEDQEDHVRIEPHRRQTRRQRHEQSAEDEKNRMGDTDAAREQLERRGSGEKDEDELDGDHSEKLAMSPPVRC